MDAIHFPASSGASAAPQTFTFTLTAASYWHWTSPSIHSIGFINSFHFFFKVLKGFFKVPCGHIKGLGRVWNQAYMWICSATTMSAVLIRLQSKWWLPAVWIEGRALCCVYKYIHEHIIIFMNATEFLRKKSVYRHDSRPSPRVWRSGWDSSLGTTPHVSTLCLSDITTHDQISLSIFAYCKWSNTGGGNGLGKGYTMLILRRSDKLYRQWLAFLRA